MIPRSPAGHMVIFHLAGCVNDLVNGKVLHNARTNSFLDQREEKQRNIYPYSFHSANTDIP